MQVSFINTISELYNGIGLLKQKIDVVLSIIGENGYMDLKPTYSKLLGETFNEAMELISENPNSKMITCGTVNSPLFIVGVANNVFLDFENISKSIINVLDLAAKKDLTMLIDLNVDILDLKDVEQVSNIMKGLINLSSKVNNFIVNL